MADFDMTVASQESTAFSGMREAASQAADAVLAAPEPLADHAVEAAPAPVAGQAPERVAGVVDDSELDPETMGDRKVKIKVDGEWQTVSLKEAAAGYSRTSAYTKRMQDLATQRAEVDAFKTEKTQLLEQQKQTQAFLNNPELVLRYLQQAQPQLFQPQQQPIGDPNEIATIDQANQLIEQRVGRVMAQLQQMEQQTTQRIAQATNEIQNRAQTGKYIEALNHTVKQVFEAHPILNHVKNVEDNIRYEVAKLKPTTIEEAQSAFLEVAKGMAEDLELGFASANKTKLATAEKLKTSRIEPPGGSGPQLQPTNHKNSDGSLNWKSLTNAAKAAAERD